MNAQAFFETESGVSPAPVIHFSAGLTLSKPPITQLDAIRVHGSQPMLTWAPGDTAADVNAGKYDARINTYATALAGWGYPVWVRMWQEMNATWFAWNAVGNPAAWVKAWRRVTSMFAAAGASNVSWIWCPNVNYETNLRAMYPGDDAVTLLGLDGYNVKSPSKTNWKSFSQVFDQSWTNLLTIGPQPVVICETGCLEDPKNTARKPAWLAAMWTHAATLERLGALVYFNRAGTTGGTYNWYIESSSASVKAWHDGAVAA
jgi:beta-mannanase